VDLFRPKYILQEVICFINCYNSSFGIYTCIISVICYGCKF